MKLRQIDALFESLANQLTERRKSQTPNCRKHCIIRVYEDGSGPPSSRLSRAFAICTKIFPDPKSAKCKKHDREPSSELKSKERRFEAILKAARKNRAGG